MRHARLRRIAVVLSLLMGSLPFIASAQVVIYRCTDASGAVTLQNGTPCPKGTKQQKKVMETPPSAPMPFPSLLPAPAPAPATTTPSPSAAAALPPVIAPEPEPVAAKQPPPPLYECNTWDRQRYLGDVAQPPARCVPVQVTGLDGQGASAGGTACQMMEDRCQPVPEARLCEAWTQRLRDLQSRPATDDAGAAQAQVDIARVRDVLHGSTCSD